MKKIISLVTVLIIFSVFSVASARESVIVRAADPSAVYVYHNLIEYVVPTAKLNCSYFDAVLKMYDIAYSEIQGLSTESCYKGLFDATVKQIKFVLDNGACHKENDIKPDPIVKPSVTVPAGETQIWGINYGDAIWTRAGAGGAWQNIPGGLRYLDRLPKANGGLIWGINSAQNIYYRDGVNGAWNHVPGALVFLRIAFDGTVWGINEAFQVYSLTQNDVSKAAWVYYPNIQLQYLDVSRKDGRVYGISKDFKIYTTEGAGFTWNEMPGLKVKFLRVLSNGNLFAIDQAERKVFFKNTHNSEWQELGDDYDYGFTFIDVNNNGQIYGIKSDGSTWFRDYVDSTWVNCNMKLSTLRVLDDNTVWGLTYKDYGDQSNSLVYFRESSSSGWKNIPGGLVTLWGPFNPAAGDSQLWGLNGGDAIWTRYSSAGNWQNIGGGLRQLDRVATIAGGLIWGINSAQNIYYRKGVNGGWVNVPGALTSLRISQYDNTVWGINKNKQVYFLRETDVNQALWNNEASVSFYYLDISPRDGSVYGICDNNQLWMKATLSSAWVEIKGLSVAFVRVNAQGLILAIEYGTKKLYYKTTVDSDWKALGPETGFTYVDINSFGVIYAIKTDLSTWYRYSISSSWVDTNMQLKTLRVLEDGGAWGLGWRDYGDFVNDNVYYKRDNQTSWKNIPGGLISLWGPSNILSGDHQMWGLNSGDAIWTRDDPSSKGKWQNIGGGLRYLDRLPTQEGGYIWGINSGHSIFYRDGISGAWVHVPGGLNYLRISAYDRTIWGINANNQVYYLKQSAVASAAWVNVPSISLKYLDVNPDDGSVFGVDTIGRLWRTDGAGKDWNQIDSMRVILVRVFESNKILAVGSDGKIYGSRTSTISWKPVGGESGFVFVDANSEGIYGIKSDQSTWFFNHSTWTNTNLASLTLRCLENGGVWAITPSQTIFYKKNQGAQWENVPGGLISLWGPTNYKYF